MLGEEDGRSLDLQRSSLLSFLLLCRALAQVLRSLDTPSLPLWVLKLFLNIFFGTFVYTFWYSFYNLIFNF